MSAREMPPAAPSASSSSLGSQARIVQLVAEAVRNGNHDGRMAPIGQSTRRSPALTVDLNFQGMHVLPQAVIDLVNGDVERSLETLDLGYNRLRAVPEEIVHLSSLTTLSIQHNLITKLPFCIGSMASLKSLKVDGNPLGFPPPEVLRPLQALNTTDIYVAERIKRFLGEHEHHQFASPTGEPDLIDAANAIVKCLLDLHKVLLTLGSSTRQTITTKSPLERIVERTGIYRREVQLYVDFAVDEDSGDAKLGLQKACTKLLEACSRICSEILNNIDQIVDKAGTHKVRALLGLMHSTCMQLRQVVLARHIGQAANTSSADGVVTSRPASRQIAAGSLRDSPLHLGDVLPTAVLTRDSGPAKTKASAPFDRNTSFDLLSRSLQEACGLVLAIIRPLSDQILASWSKDTARKPGSHPASSWEDLLTTCSRHREKTLVLRGCLTSSSPRDLGTRAQSLLIDSASQFVISWTQIGESLKKLRNALRLSTNVKNQLHIIQTNMKQCAQQLRLWTELSESKRRLQ
ncbi:Leucine-rich repeat-containing protein 57 [Colletotrichum shisoi]|uniref:Leucine-rich repeat-containing protein 57 n=1 Tax=Colletotrichum shisoi TaxID=2078593 RepID=A0A5Q4BCI0_9PEZI|nr:Leucine-rich repeat-containing protein 57 [Colletotrichum shisoi]